MYNWQFFVDHLCIPAINFLEEFEEQIVGKTARYLLNMGVHEIVALLLVNRIHHLQSQVVVQLLHFGYFFRITLSITFLKIQRQVILTHALYRIEHLNVRSTNLENFPLCWTGSLQSNNDEPRAFAFLNICSLLPGDLRIAEAVEIIVLHLEEVSHL